MPAIVKGAHGPTRGDRPVWASGSDQDMPMVSRRWEIPLAAIDPVEGVWPNSETAFEIRGVTITNNSPLLLEGKWGYETILGNMQTEADFFCPPFYEVNRACERRGIHQLAYQLTGPTHTTVPGSIIITVVPIYLPNSSYALPGLEGQLANSIEVHSNAAFANGGDTGALAFTNLPITSVILMADTQPMNFYIGQDTAHMTGPLPVLAGEKMSFSGNFGAYRVTNTSGSAGGYRVLALYGQ